MTNPSPSLAVPVRRTVRSHIARRAGAAVLAVAVACGSLVATALPAQAATYGTISAHRGGGWGPDNSMKAFTGALGAEIRDIEGDVYFTTDDVGVFHHDNALGDCHSARTITGSSWAQLIGLRCTDGVPLAKLADVLRAFRASSNTSAVLRVEVKHHGESAAGQQAAARLLVQRLAEQNMVGRAVIQDFNWRTTAATIHAASSSARVSCLETDVRAADIPTAKSQGCHDLSYNYTNWRDGLNEAIHTRGMLVAVYTVNSAATFRRFRTDLHANVIITDTPGAALGW